MTLRILNRERLESCQGFVRGCESRRNLGRATITAGVVGPLLVLINMTSVARELLHGILPSLAQAFRVGLTFLVPFLVSLYSSAMADARRSRLP